MSTRNVTGAQVRQSMVTSGSAVKSRQLVSVPCPMSTILVILSVLVSSSGRIYYKLPYFVQMKPNFLTGTNPKQAQLNSQLAQLSSNLSDTENLLRMTSVQAEAMRGLGSWHGGL
jgi:hypothetical protein